MLRKTVWLFLSLFLLWNLYSGLLSTAYASPSVDDWLNNLPADDQPIDREEEVVDEENELLDQEQSGETGPSFAMLLVQLVFALAIVIGLIYVLLKFMGNKNKMFQKVRALENLGGIALGSNKSLQVVRIGERYYVIGVGENVELLSEITDEQTKKELMADDSTIDFKPADFLTSIFQKQRNTQNSNIENSTDDYPKQFKNELNRMIEGRKKITERFSRKEDDSHE